MWHILCDFGVCCNVAKQLKCGADFWYGLLFISEYSDPALDGCFLLLLLLILRLCSLELSK